MKYKRNRSELGLSIMEVMIALSVLFIILYQTLLYDFETPKSKVKSLLNVDYSFKEISGLLADKRICKETFKDKKLLTASNTTQIFDIKAKKCEKCPYPAGNANRNLDCEECSGSIWCKKGACDIYIYESSDKISNPINGRMDSELNKVNVSKIDGHKTHEKVEIKSMKLKGFKQKEVSLRKRYGYTDLIIEYKVSGSNNSSGLNTFIRRIPIFVTADKISNKIEDCSLSSTYCSKKDVEILPDPSINCSANADQFKFMLDDSETGGKIRKKIDPGDCTCIGSFFCYNGYWSYPPPLCFKTDI